MDRLVAENHSLKRTLSRDINDYSRVPFAIASALMVQPRWRAWLDDMAVKWAPTLEYSRAAAARRRSRSSFMHVFDLIASENSEGAHAALSAAGFLQESH